MTGMRGEKDCIILQDEYFSNFIKQGEKEMKRRFRNAIYMSKSKLTGQG